jgi:hypothetical protein
VLLSVGPSVVALAAIGAAFLQQHRTLRHERQLRDIEAVREASTTAALKFVEAESVIALWRSDLRSSSRCRPTSE